MNVYDWMKENEQPDSPPLNEPGTREDPGNRPHVPDDEDGTTRELHSNAGGGRVTDTEEHHVEHTIADPYQPVEEEPEETISNEGLIESVRKFFGVHNRGSKFVELDGNASASIGKIYKTIEGTFASKEWLDKQTPVKGDVKVADLLDDINVKSLVSSVQETFAINLAFAQAVDKAQLEVIKALKPALSLWNATNLTDKAYETTLKLLETVPSVSDVIKKPTRTKTNLLPSKGEPTAPALSIDAILELASTINNCIKTDIGRIDEQGEMLDKYLGVFTEAHYQITREDGASESYNTQAWEKLASRVFSKLSHNSIQEAYAAMRQFSATCICAVIYMERSIKGGKVSNEEFTVSNEGIVDKIMKLFTPGKDKNIHKAMDVISVNVLAKELKDKYANPTWVKRQGVNEGMVSVSAANLVDKKYDAEINEHITALKAERSRLDKSLPPALKALEELISFLPTMTSDKDLAKARELLTKAQEFDRLKFQKQKDSSKPGEVPALTEAEVVSKTRALLAVFEQTEVTSNYRSEFERVVKSSTPGAHWYRNWQYVESKSRNGLVAKLSDKVSSEKLNAFLDTYERALTWISANVPGVADLRPIQAHIRARFEQIEKSVK